MTSTSRKWEIVQDVIQLAVPTIAAFFLIRQIFSHLKGLDPEYRQDAESKRTAAAAKAKIQSILGSRDEDQNSDDEDHPFGEERPAVADLQLTHYEQVIAGELIAPKDIAVSFDDIGGLEDIIEELKESVIYPLTMPHLYSHSSSLLSAPSGVLLYGPPGCGKTMLAKALARESGACFINLHISTLTEKWYGDSNKLVKAVFSLARKLQPTIVFIDEIDAVLGQRRSGEHEASGMVKAEFMTHWDGLVSSNSQGKPQRICVMGATNRIQDIDEAILRRMPKKFPVPLPNGAQRRGIFKLILRGTKVDQRDFDLDYLVKVSAGLSGSDIKETCRDAAMVPMREYIKAQAKAGKLSRTGVNPEEVRGVRTEDFFGKRGEIPHTTNESVRASTIAEVEDSDRAWTDDSSESEPDKAEKPTVASR